MLKERSLADTENKSLDIMESFPNWILYPCYHVQGIWTENSMKGSQENDTLLPGQLDDWLVATII